MKTFYQKRILITGAASGIGKLMAEKLAKHGAHLILVDLNLEGLKYTSEVLRLQGHTINFFQCDLSNYEQMLSLKQQIKNDVGNIDMLINNAGVVYGGEFEKISLEKHILTYQINLNAVVTLTHQFFEDLLLSSDSHIVNIASASGMIGLPFGVSYASSKWAVIGFSESIRLELNERGYSHVHVTTVCPSYIDTGMFAGVKAPMLIPWIKPEMIVDKILSAVLKNKAFVREPLIVKFVEGLRGCLPIFVFDYVAKLIGVSTSMQHWKGRGGN